MGKFLKYLVFAVIIVFVLAFFAWNMFPNWVSSTLSDKMGVKVSIQSIGASFSSVDVDNLSVGNPPKSILPRALGVKEINVEVPITRFLDKDLVIPYMHAQDIYLGIEFDSQGSKTGNWTTIINNMNKSSPPSKPEDQKTVLIKKLVLENIQIELAYRDTKKVTTLKPVKRLELDNISSEGGVPTAVIMNIVMQQMLDQIFSIQGLQNMLDSVIPGGGSGSYDPFKGLF